MTTTALEVDICNMALGWIGAEPIVALTDNSTRANLCELHYPRARDAVLESREWSFAVEHNILDTPDVTPPTNPKWGQRFPIASTTLRVLTVKQPSDVTTDLITNGMVEAEQIPWEKEGAWILCNFDEISVRTIERITTTTEFSEGFVHALAARLAADLAIPIAASLSLQQQMYSLYLEKLNDACAADGMQGRSQRIRSRYLLARR